MSIWVRFREAVNAFFSGVLDFSGSATPPEKSVAFTIAVVALGAKIAKADGRVTGDEVNAFREVFHIDDADLPDVSRFFDHAKRDPAGYEIYARRVAAMFVPGSPILADLLDGLFYIAGSDGEFHPDEQTFLAQVAAAFGFHGADYERIRARHIPSGPDDPYLILGVSRDDSTEAISAARRALAHENHPDRLMARGVPREAARLTEQRMAAINAAYDAIVAERARFTAR